MPIPAAFLIVVLVWSTTPLAVKWSSSADVSFLEGVAIRMLAAAIIASVLLRVFNITRHYSSAALRLYACGALGFFGAMSLLYWAAQYVPSGVIALIFGSAPLFAGALGALLLGERTLTGVRVFALLTALCGLGLVFRGQVSVNVSAAPAVAALLIATLFYALSSVLVKRYAVSMHPLAQVTGALWLTALGFVSMWWLSDGTLPDTIDARTLGAISYLTVFGSVLAFMLYFYLLTHLPVTTVALITLITPPCALVIGWLLAGEQLSVEILAGGGVIMLGLLVYQWGDQLLLGCRARP